MARSNTDATRTRTGIVIHSNAPWTGTGYGVQTAHLAKAIRNENRKVTLSVNYGLSGGISNWEGIEVLPTGYHPYSADVLEAHTKYVETETKTPTALVTLFDCWVYKNSNVDSIPVIASWVPIDHTPAPLEVLDWCNRPNVLPVAMAQFGLKELERADIDAMYAPHGVDTQTFTPGRKFNGATGRNILNIPDDAFVVGMVAANKGISPLRKAWGENLLALALFMQQHDDVWLYLHTEKRGAHGGIDLLALTKAAGVPEDRIVWVDQWAYYCGISTDILATIFGSFDVNLACSRGEGFGVPVIETAACGVPSIVSNFTAQPELVGDYGWLTAVQPDWDAAQKSWFGAPVVGAIVDNLNDAYDKARDKTLRANVRSHAEQYDHRIVFDRYWKPILDEIDRRMENR
jgi:glycosyltransferase involved in cell wall biosynthesis